MLVSNVGRGHVARKGVASLEFALIAPVMGIMTLFVFDGARALAAWQETQNAAQAVVQAAEKMSVIASNTTPSLTYTQMQNAMSTIYEEMPWIWPGDGTGILPGNYSVTLSEIEYLPLCPSSNVYTCAVPQIPHTLWSTYLQEGGAKLIKSASVQRQCGALTRVFPTWNNYELGAQPTTRWGQMVDPSRNGEIGFVMPPQILADVQYQFTPTFALLLPKKPTITFIASAMLPTPVGNNALPIAYTSSPNDSNVNYCNPP
jgi:hypothetical protein